MIEVPLAAGTFYSRVTRDAHAQDRDGERFFQYRELDEEESTPERGRLFEVMFGDGVWMLAREQDLDFSETAPQREEDRK